MKERKREREKKRMSGSGHRDREGSREGGRRRHGDGHDGRGGNRHRHRARSGGRHGHGHRTRSQDRHDEGHRHRHRHPRHLGERDHDHRRHGSRDRSDEVSRHRHRGRSNRRNRSHGRDIRESVTEGPSDPNLDLMMTGSAGPAGTLPTNVQHPHSRPRSQSHRRRSIPKPGRSGVSQRHGPDDKTPFGELPKKAAGVGVAAHFLNTYRHIKAEHDAGHRTRSVVEKTMDGWRGKTAKYGEAGKGREPEKSRKDDHKRSVERGDNGRSRKGNGNSEHGRSDRGQQESRHHHQRGDRDGGEGRPRDVDREGAQQDNGQRRPHNPDQRRGPASPYAPRNLSPHQSPPGNTQLPYRSISGAPLTSGAHDSLSSRTPTPPEIHIQGATPPSNTAPAWPPTPESFIPPRPSSSSFRQAKSDSRPRSRGISPSTPESNKPGSRSTTPRSVQRTRSQSRPRQRSPSRSSSRGRNHPPSPSRSISPPYPDKSSDRDRSISPIHMPPPPAQVNSSIPPPPPAPPGNPKPTPGHAALFNRIQGNIPKLRKVRSSEKKDKSEAASAGQVYEDTPHSRDVEERERGQHSGRAWSDLASNVDVDGEGEARRRKRFEEELAAKFRGR